MGGYRHWWDEGSVRVQGIQGMQKDAEGCRGCGRRWGMQGAQGDAVDAGLQEMEGTGGTQGVQGLLGGCQRARARCARRLWRAFPGTWRAAGCVPGQFLGSGADLSPALPCPPEPHPSSDAEWLWGATVKGLPGHDLPVTVGVRRNQLGADPTLRRDPPCPWGPLAVGPPCSLPLTPRPGLSAPSATGNCWVSSRVPAPGLENGGGNAGDGLGLCRGCLQPSMAGLQ